MRRKKGDRRALCEAPVGPFRQSACPPFSAGHYVGRARRCWAGTAYAHKLNVFASAEGKTIRGKAYFGGGTPAQNVAVTALSPTGQQIGQTTTDEEGRFALEARFRCDYRLLVETGDGHGGEYTVPASVLPKDLPLLSADLGDGKVAGDVGRSPNPSIPIAPAEPTAAVPLSSDQLELLHAKIDHLEEQLMAYEDRLRVTDVLGGIGYIVGITGAAYYYFGSRRKRAGS